MEIALDCNDYFQCMMAWDRYAPEIIGVLGRIVQPGDRVVDVGAHVGYISLNMAELVGKEGHVYSFEPDPRAREQLLASVAMNEQVRVTVSSRALSNELRTIPFYLPQTLGWSTAVAGSHLNDLQTVNVGSVPFDHCVDDGSIIGPIRLMKIDVEGWEPNVLKGMCGTLKRDKPALIIELNTLMLSAGGSSTKEVIDLVEDFGYEVSILNQACRLWSRRTLGATRYLDGSADVNGDILCVHRDDRRTRDALLGMRS